MSDVAAAWFIQDHFPVSEMMRRTQPAMMKPTTMCTTYGCMKPMFGIPGDQSSVCLTRQGYPGFAIPASALPVW